MRYVVLHCKLLCKVQTKYPPDFYLFTQRKRIQINSLHSLPKLISLPPPLSNTSSGAPRCQRWSVFAQSLAISDDLHIILPASYIASAKGTWDDFDHDCRSLHQCCQDRMTGSSKIARLAVTTHCSSAQGRIHPRPHRIAASAKCTLPPYPCCQDGRRPGDCLRTK